MLSVSATNHHDGVFGSPVEYVRYVVYNSSLMNQETWRDRVTEHGGALYDP